MSYRLIDANALNNKISTEDYEIIMKEPEVFADLPNGLDGGFYIAVPAHEGMTNGDVIEATGLFDIIGNLSNDMFICVGCNGFTSHAFMSFSRAWWNAPYKRTEG